ncbi:hypothetical protein PR202_ga16946 [Eleusine coracana subsp. coracana]|uniref:G patch domain-containing protein TGH homolog n=1 Tax=Eleusine coracana subsp. coracana TaxID=191504 RepID=A0AAV5CP78_ELECO|nr:hypothetical protein PR202_ga16946 [Eleusine coracana subsp. coracana]
MGADSDEEDFVAYGTPIEREEDTSARKRRAIAEAGQLRALPAWKQEVRDEEGRRRFHGAFTGGFSAGFYNTVGSKEGVKLLMKMGWRQGRSIKDSHADSLYESRRNARKAFLALSGIKNDEDQDKIDSDKPSLDQSVTGSSEEMHASGSTPAYVLHPKQDLHGLGYDPFKHAPEFRDRKRFVKSRGRDHKRNDISARGNLLISNSGHYAPGFGIGALEELDVEDEDIYASGFAYELTEVDIEPSKTSDGNYKLDDRKRGIFLSFKIASNSEYKLERFPPPDIPADFDGRHKFATPTQPAEKFSDLAPPEVPPPEDSTVRLLIEGCAAMVARGGKHIEDFYKEKSKTNPQFHFLSGGDGCSYYTRKLWENQFRYTGQPRPDAVKSKPSSDKLTAENRGKILGERPLDRSTKPHLSLSAKEAVQLQSNLIDTFVKPISLDALPESEKPFSNDPAKQARFEQFLKDKYQGGLRTATGTPVSTMSEADRARERLDFEAAAEAIEKGKEKVIKPSSVLSLPGMNEQRFVSATQLEPMPVQRPRSKIENLIFMTESTKGTKDEEESSSKSLHHASGAGLMEVEAQGMTNDTDIEPSSVQRPVDLYKAIFSDDSDDDTDEILNHQPVDPVKTSEGANMALNRLAAEDFLQSLGKEFGLEIPPERPNVLVRSEALSVSGASVSTQNEMIATTRVEIKENQSSHGMVEIGNANEDAPLASAEILDLKYKKREHRTEESRSHPLHRQNQNYNPNSDSSSEHHRSRKRRLHHHTRSRTPESDSSTERHNSRRRKSHSKHRRARSKTPDGDSPSDTQHDERKHKEKRCHQTYTPDTDSSDHGYRDRRKSSSRRSSDKDKSRKHSRRHKHRRKDHAE